MTATRGAALRQWVEETAMLFEREGLPRMAGRIFGWLLVCEPAEQSMEDLAGALQGSKASMSTMTRMLTKLGLIDRFRPPGTRRDLYRIRPGHWDRLWESRLAQLRETTELAARGVALLSGRPVGSRRRLEEFHEQYAFLGRELPRLLERWRRERAAPIVARSPRRGGGSRG